jgi:hypothetical protein
MHGCLQVATGMVVDILAGSLHLKPVEQFYRAWQQFFVFGADPRTIGGRGVDAGRDEQRPKTTRVSRRFTGRRNTPCVCWP